MLGSYSITIQVSYDSVWDPTTSHVAVVVNTPFGQTHAGFGPAHHGVTSLGGGWSRGQYDVQAVQPGDPLITTGNFATVLGHSNLAAFTLPGTETQALSTLIYIHAKETEYLLDSLAEQYGFDQVARNYNGVGILGGDGYVYVCTNPANEALRVWTGSNQDLLPFTIPEKNFKYLDAISNALTRNPDAQRTADGRAIPAELRGLERDYPFLRNWLDTPAERVRFAEQAQSGWHQSSYSGAIAKFW